MPTPITSSAPCSVSAPVPATFSRSLLLALFTGLAPFITVGTAQTTVTWANAGAVANTSSNWVGSPTLGNSSSNSTTGNIWSFSNTGPNNNTVTFTSSRNIWGIGFTSTANAYTIAGGTGFTLTIGSTGITNNSASNSQTITSPVITGASQTWTTVAGGNLTVDSVSITSSASTRTLTIAGAGTTNLGSLGFAAAGNGAGSLTKTGSGTLNLTGTNTYNGTTTINEGTVVIANGNSSSANSNFTLDLGAGATVLPVLKLNHVNALATSAMLTGTGTAANAGTVNLSVAGNYTLGSYNGNSMKFSAGSGSATTLNFSNNSVVTSGSNGSRVLTNLDSNLSIVFGGTLDISSSVNGGVTFASVGNTRVNGAIFNSSSGLRSITKTEAGTLTLAGVNTYNGNTTISAGKLALTGSGSIGSSSTIINNGTFDVSAVTGGNYALGSTQTYAGSGTTIGNLTINGAFTPGNSPGLATFNNDLTLGSTSTTTMEIGGNVTPGTDFDRVSVTGALTFGGTLNIVSFGTYDLAQPASFGLFSAGSMSGNFSSVSVASTALANSNGVWSATSGGLGYTFSTLNGELIIGTAIPEPATAAALGGGALLGLTVLRRRRRV